MYTYSSSPLHMPHHLAAAALIAFFSAPSGATASCAEWALQLQSGGSVYLIESNDLKYPRSLIVTQSRGQFKGMASHNTTNNLGDRGPIGGTITADSFSATVYWTSGSTSIYTGTIDPQGLLSGRVVDKANPLAATEFHASAPLGCRSQTPSAPGLGTAAAKPNVALGRAAPAAATPSSPTSICEAAKSARARNSPAAPGLERQCNAFGAPASSQSIAPAQAQLAAVKNKADAVSLNPQPLPPKTATNPSPLTKATGKADAVSLNPQPLPPAAPTVLPAQAPSALR